jgi:hypothetical protein
LVVLRIAKRHPPANGNEAGKEGGPPLILADCGDAAPRHYAAAKTGTAPNHPVQRMSAPDLSGNGSRFRGAHSLTLLFGGFEHSPDFPAACCLTPLSASLAIRVFGFGVPKGVLPHLGQRTTAL